MAEELEYNKNDVGLDPDNSDDEDEGDNAEGCEFEDISDLDSGGIDDPVAEGDDPVTPKPEPSHAKASETKFLTICKGLEVVYKKNQKKERMKDKDKLNTILKAQYLQKLAESTNPPESIFPVLRLLMPEKDGSRSFLMKEKLLAKMYSGAFGFAPNTSKYNKLFHFTNPIMVKPEEGIGDFSMVVYKIMGSIKRKATKSDSNGMSVGELNKYLDELASLPAIAREAKSNHDWRRDANNHGTSGLVAAGKPPNLNQLRIDWLKKIDMDTPKRQGLSPLEHKWLVRILLNKLGIGIGSKAILNWYNEYATMLWSAHNSLRGICDKLCDPEFSRTRVFAEQHTGSAETSDNRRTGLDSYMPKSLVAPQFGIPFSPMLSVRTGFGSVLDDISRRHRFFLKSDDSKDFEDLISGCLSFEHPAFAVEPKLDGERMIVHVSRDGIVKMHSRKSNWYSDLYSPVLGPPIRRSVEKWNFDIILDGEVLAWDSGRQETVPFGNNRTIANLRYKWMERNNLLDARDRNIHVGESGVKSMNATNTRNNKNSVPYELAGEECWLQFIAFDVLFVDGPGAEVFLTQTISPISSFNSIGGSIINLDGFERKKILYKLITPQKHEMEIVKTWIIRPNGRTSLGEDYFDPENPTKECGFPEHTLDSLNCILAEKVKNIRSIDISRRNGRSDRQISQARAQSLQKMYDDTVENQRMEGLVFKDLSAPYFLGEESKTIRYWYKFKPDYFNGSAASDVDVVVIGAYFATGLRFSGKPSSFLCACVDSEDEERFFTLCKVNMGSTDTATAYNFLEATGFANEDETEASNIRNSWFREVDHGKTLPDFLSTRSYQSKSIDGTWRFTKNDYPDLWIRPEDSRILTLNAGEIVISDAFSAGVTLRFPRINKIREGADDKPRSQIESDVSLWKIYQSVTESRSAGNIAVSIRIGSPLKQDLITSCRFLTEEQYENAKSKKKRSNVSKFVHSVPLPKTGRVVSKALQGLSFNVLNGNYFLKNGGSGMEEAQEEGWISVGMLVQTSDDVRTFIKNHGGRYVLSPEGEDTIVLGGSRKDPAVLAFVQSIEAARFRQTGRLKSKRAEAEALKAQKHGVLRWFFVYSLVHRWLNGSAAESETRSDQAIKDHRPDWLLPSVLDFLARPSTLNGLETDLLDVNMASVAQMRRAIEVVSETQSSSKWAKHNFTDNSWQKAAIDNLRPDERWAVASDSQSLWPYNARSSSGGTLTIIYPHIFEDLGGFETRNEQSSDDQRWKCVLSDPDASMIESVLPLARVMGAEITPHLHIRVTHVLCDLRVDEAIVFSETLTENLFNDTYRGLNLLCRLRKIREKKANHQILLISTSWLRKRKWQR